MTPFVKAALALTLVLTIAFSVTGGAGHGGDDHASLGLRSVMTR
ncbi:hypothetical protein [Anianabacter salinae]|nr:hypothetical protein [Anianabacter salinae]